MSLFCRFFIFYNRGMMRKTDKKTENAIREALTEVCDLALQNVAGFKWLTHKVTDFKALSESLYILCVFETNENISDVLNEQKDEFIFSLIKEKLNIASIDVKNIRKQVRLDSEEACEKYHDGKWQERFK
ncbi:MAG: hypothetical protein ACI9T7_002892 [Oleiphilaceae bacterium]